MASRIVSEMLRSSRHKKKGKSGSDFRGGAYKAPKDLAAQESGQLSHSIYPKHGEKHPPFKKK